MNGEAGSGATASRYRYRAARPDGSIDRGTVSAVGEREVRRRLQREGLAVLEIRPGRSLPGIDRVRRQDLAVLFRNVAILVKSGVPVEQALATGETLVKGRLRKAVAEVRRRIREGTPVSDAMEAAGGSSRGVFSRSVVGVVRAGERGSRLPEACETVAEQLEEEVRLRSEIRSALTYPALILLVGLASILVMGMVVVPRFADVLEGMGAELPTGTKVLLTGSMLVQRFALPGLVGISVVTALLIRWARTPAFRRRLDPFLLSLPLVGRLRHGFSSARTCRALGGMLRTGMPLLAALETAREASGDLEISRRLHRAREAVSRGRPLTEALSSERALTPVALQIVGIGESSGRLGEMLGRAGELVAERARRSLRSLVGLLEPALVIVLGAFVAGVAAALLQAVYAIRPS